MVITDQSCSLIRQFRGLGPDFVERSFQRRLLLLKSCDLILESLQIRGILGNNGRNLRFGSVAFSSESSDLVPEIRDGFVEPSDLLSDAVSQLLASVL